MRVLVPSPLRSYPGGCPEVAAEGATLAELLLALEAGHPGIRFRMIDEHDRIRTHIKFFIGERQADALDEPLAVGDVVQIVCALSGG